MKERTDFTGFLNEADFPVLMIAGKKDNFTGLPDDLNGRFTVLGWTKPFSSQGEMTLTLKWREGKIPKENPHAPLAPKGR